MNNEEIEKINSEPIKKRGRGRPRKTPVEKPPKRKPGRKIKIYTEEEIKERIKKNRDKATRYYHNNKEKFEKYYEKKKHERILKQHDIPKAVGKQIKCTTLEECKIKRDIMASRYLKILESLDNQIKEFEEKVEN